MQAQWLATSPKWCARRQGRIGPVACGLFVQIRQTPTMRETFNSQPVS
jgi:hypothetical protein